jgi:hypothetical protein
MAKQAKSNRAAKARRNEPAQNSRTRKNRLQQTIGRLDASAAQFARLLSDPCNGSLCHPVYSGSDVGYLGRYETDFTFSSIGSNGASSNAGALLFAPGCIGVSAADTNTSSGNNAVMKLGILANGISDTTTVDFTCAPPGVQPGSNFFAFGSEAVRPVAACLQVFYTGTELNRAGTVSLARVNAGSVLNSSGTCSVASLRSLSQYVDRTPASHYEIVWTPADGDQLFTDPSLITLQRQTERKNGILMTFSGLDPSLIRVRLVVVYEWIPEPGQGLIIDSSSRNRSNNSLDHVLNALDGAGRWWIRNANTIGTLYKFGSTMLGGM